MNEIVHCIETTMAENMLTMIEGPEINPGIGFSVIFIPILFVISALTAIHVYFKSRESYKFAIRIPGPEPIPILGNALMAIGKTPNGESSLQVVQVERRKVIFFAFSVCVWTNIKHLK